MGKFKVIHWEFNPGALGPRFNQARALLFLGHIKNGETDQINGFYCRWRCRVFSQWGLVIGIIAEQNFELNPAFLKKETLMTLIDASFFEFQYEFNTRLEPIDIQVETTFEIEQVQIIDFLNQTEN